MEKTLYTAAAAAQALGISKEEIQRQITLGHIYAFNLGSAKMPRYYVRSDVLEELINEKTSELSEV